MTQCFRGGATEAEIVEMIGHSDSNIVGRYRHLRNVDRQRAIARVTFFEASTKPGGPADVEPLHHDEGGAHDDENGSDNEAA